MVTTRKIPIKAVKTVKESRNLRSRSIAYVEI
jgi:hypothetical protein